MAAFNYPIDLSVDEQFEALRLEIDLSGPVEQSVVKRRRIVLSHDYSKSSDVVLLDGVAETSPSASCENQKLAGSGEIDILPCIGVQMRPRASGSIVCSSASSLSLHVAPVVSQRMDSMVAQLVGMDFDPEQALCAAERCSTIEGALKYLLGDSSLNSNAQQLFSCPVCLDDFKIGDMVTLSCLHRMCVDCFVGYCTCKINDGEVLSNQLCCPTILSDGTNNVCSTPITIHEIKAFVPCAVFEKYDRFTTRAYCEDEQMRSCPKCNEWYIDLSDVLCIESLWSKLRCANCHHPFCGKCGQAPHKNQADQDISCEAMAAWLAANGQEDESLTTYMKNNKLFPCPNCNNAAELSQGCKFLYCRCKANFCALCGKALTEKEHFSHFSGGAGCTGPFGNICLGSCPNIVSASGQVEIANAAAPVPLINCRIQPAYLTPPQPKRLPKRPYQRKQRKLR